MAMTEWMSAPDEPPVSRPAPRRHRLLVIDPADAHLMYARRFVLDRPLLRLGRHRDAEIMLDGESVSRRHAHLEWRADVWWLADDGSTHGTRVNGEPLEAPRPLRHRDRIAFGHLVCEYRGPGLPGPWRGPEFDQEHLRDELTDTFNRRFLRHALQRALHEVDELCVVLLDVDDFKTLNEQHSMPGAEFVVQEMAHHLCLSLPHVFIARVGGDEFALVLPGASPREAFSVAEQVRKWAAGHRFTYRGDSMVVTVSAGVTSRTEADRSADDLLARATEKLREAKNSGRDRVCIEPAALA